MPALIPFVPLIAAGVGAGATLWNGARQDRANQATLNQANQATAAQQALIGQLMSGINPEAYRAQAAQSTQDALGQLTSNFAQRGMLNSGALTTAGMQAAARAQTDAMTRLQQDRMSAYGMALGGQQSIGQQYMQRINPDPYAGVGASLGAVGTAAGQYLMGRYGQGSATPTTGVGLPGFGVTYPR